MQQYPLYGDERWASFCVFCGRPPTTRDHTPPRIFLDEPFPDNVPRVSSCLRCNAGASLDEEYVACLLEVAACGTAEPDKVRRPKIANTLRARPKIAAKLAGSFRPSGDFLVSEEDKQRIVRVIEKIARALWAFEVEEPALDASVEMTYIQISQLDDEQLREFYELDEPELFPEVGSRMLQRLAVVNDTAISNTWEEVQEERFSYAVQIFADGNGRVKMILGEYIAATVDLHF